MEGLYTNTSERNDYLFDAIRKYSSPACKVRIAVPFFTQGDEVKKLAKKGCSINIVVRLGYPTNPNALQALIDQEGIQVRYLTDERFHSKLFIFDERCAIIGSSNMTGSGLKSNQEVNAIIDIEDPRYSELVKLFNEYWKSAKVYDSETAKSYRKIYSSHYDNLRGVHDIENDIREKIGVVGVDARGLKKSAAKDVELEGYRKTYQQFEEAYREVERIYKSFNKRKHPEEVLPLRIEIDQFLNYVREKKAISDSYKDAPKLYGDERERKVTDAIKDWFDTEWSYLDENVLNYNYPIINQIMGSKESIDEASYDDIIKALSYVHSFYDRYRFYKGGHETHITQFKEKNDLEKVKKSFKYLLFGDDNFIERMGRCIDDPNYNLLEFGRSGMQELLGWLNKDNIPICNERTLRSLRWLGFDVVLVGG